MNVAHLYLKRAIRDRMPVLVLAAIVVGIAISIDGDSRRIVNGLGGILWIVATIQIVIGSVAAGVTRKQIGLVIAVILVLSSLITPRDPVWAAIGFGWGGVIVGYSGRHLGSRMGALLGSLWLPAHLVLAITRAGIRELRDQPATLRSDPPPKALLVPLIMVTAAWLFAILAQDWRTARSDGRLLVPRSPVRTK